MTKYISIKNVFLIFLGALILSIGINLFLSNAKLLSGGVTGIALILQYLFNIPAGLLVLIINFPIIVLCYKQTSKTFTTYTVFGNIFVAVTLILTRPLSDVLTIKDPLLLCLYGGILSGIGCGLILSNQGSTGGVDALSVIIKNKYSKFNIGTTTFIFNFAIVAVGSMFFGLGSALYTLVSMYIGGQVTDKVIKGFKNKQMLLIVTEKEQEVSHAIMSKFKRGVTYLYGEGAYSGNQRKILYCIVALNQIPELKRTIMDIDANIFISILDTSEVAGTAFKKDIIG